MVLSREDVQASLQAEKTENWLELSLAAIENELPPSLRTPAYALLNRDEQGKELNHGYDFTERQRQFEEREKQIARLDELSSEEQHAIFTALVPRLATHLEAAWQLIGQLPYQADTYRRAFRAPAQPQAYREKRVAWLRSIIWLLANYRTKDLTWFAAWTTYLAQYNTQPFGILFAAAINAGGHEGEEIFQILLASARGEHEIGRMGRHVTTGLLVAGRQDGWTFVEHLLLAAQREEGLRQVILETVDEAHPQAFRRLIALILEHRLLRFSAAVRAADVWFGFDRDVSDAADLHSTLSALGPLLDDPATRKRALEQGNPQEVYLALWATAFTDTSNAIATALPILGDAMPERRLAAVHLLNLLRLPEAQAKLFPCLADPDLRVALHAYAHIDTNKMDEQSQSEFFECVQALLQRLGGRSRSIQSGIWPWLTIQVDFATLLSTLLNCLGDRDPRCLIPYVPSMHTGDRIHLAKKLVILATWDEQVRDVLYQLLGDRTQWVSSEALKLIATRPLNEADALAIEQFLTRKSVELRRGLIELLLKGDDEAVLASASRLLTQTHALQRQAGLDLLNGMIADKRQVERATALARAYAEGNERLTPTENVLLETIFAASCAEETYTRENVLGLINPEQRTPVVPPRKRSVTIDTPAARACLHALNALIEERSIIPVLIKTGRGHEEMLLGNIAPYYLPRPDLNLEATEDERKHLPLAEAWLKWERERPASMRDEDGLELVRAALFLRQTLAAPTPPITDDNANRRPPYMDFFLRGTFVSLLAKENEAAGQEPLHLRHHQLISWLLVWLRRRQEMSHATLNFLLDTSEAALAHIDVAELVAQETNAQRPDWGRQYIRHQFSQDGGLALLQEYHTWHGPKWEAEHVKRRWQLLHWLDEPAPGLERIRPSLDVLLEAHVIGEASEADILDQLGGPATNTRHSDLRELSTHKSPVQVEKYPVLRPIVAKLRTRILEIELGRGEMPTPATELALALRYSDGTATFTRLVALLESTELARGYVSANQSKGGTWSHLLRVSAPDPEETLEAFAHQVREAGLITERLVAAALYAPQWAQHIEYVLGWPHLVEAVWWIYAHTKGSNWSVDDEIRKVWQARVAERTMVSADELINGAVDVTWFQTSYHGLGEQRWEQVYAAAKYASDGTGHGRARLYADTMTGNVDASTLRQRMFKKRQQDAVRALGLVPLPEARAEREAEIAQRYQAFQEFKRTSKQFGAQRRASEETAIRIGMENLARTAGFADPLRLQWAMEMQSTTDLNNGALSVMVEDVTVTLKLNPVSAEPALSVVGKKGKALKGLPTRLKKHEGVAHLLDRKREIEQQLSRMRVTLETSMCRGEHFTVRELLDLLAHPVLSCLLKQLIIIRDTDSSVMGYPLRSEGEDGPQLGLRDYAGHISLIEPTAADLRIAYPHDLLLAQTWHAWQRECFTVARTQPFKQVFRELYVCTSNETRYDDNALSQRYYGHQVQPRQAHALLGQRGWIVDYEEEVRRTFHAEKLTATVSFVNGAFTPNEVEGLTVGNVFFHQRDSYQPIALSSVPSRVFSETMRDLDLMVSVAHSGGVDPEASASTVEMRSALASETCALLGIENVIFKESHALIAGKLGHYSVHLGSAIVHRQPGGALCIIPVHAQHRGRIFLPFADSDPRTAEVITKIITLARDHEIKDPTILEQILSVPYG
ncbi:hypothetical protein KSD_76850 [Ktedonobacter sp. SOSP1-85]|uniref:DUF4132 domain-containing protein n=1 Tax=Ktedonobacter sp. SOSP1-85 TaxID=2778367 RepID=UPI0019154478|nr:DUF4132 domain-containing protein [Ktedonobacter sp. SOSP1-85]GHO79914.1 hypothetical protein KSD_76850 [Ktedonobacter sp. SOSP1-85]